MVPSKRQGALHLPSPRGEGNHEIPFNLKNFLHMAKCAQDSKNASAVNVAFSWIKITNVFINISLDICLICFVCFFLQEKVASESLPLLGFTVKLSDKQAGDEADNVFQLYHQNTLYYSFKAEDNFTAQRWEECSTESYW